MSQAYEEATCHKISKEKEDVQRWRVTVPLLELPFNEAARAADHSR